MTTGQKITAARKRKKIKQKELAAKLNVSAANIYQYERDKRKPKLETIRKFAAALGVSDRELMGDFELDNSGSPTIQDMLSAENWDRWVDKDGIQIFKTQAEFEEWSKDFDPEDPPLLTDYFLISDKKAPATGSDGSVDADEAELIDNYEALNREGQEILLNTSRGLIANAQYKKTQSVSAG